MKYLKKYEDHKLSYDNLKKPEEDRKPLEGECGFYSNKSEKYYMWDIKEIIDFAQKNYKVENVKVNDLIDRSLFKDVQNLKPVQGMYVSHNGELVPESELPEEELKKQRQDSMYFVMESDLSYPIILIGHDNDDGGRWQPYKYTIVDGNHRVKKAKILDKEYIKAYIIPENDVIETFEPYENKNFI
jgi:sulfur carrier protein ThiS